MNNKTNNKDDTIHLIISGKEYNIPPNSKVFQIVKNLLIQSKINSNENIYILPDQVDRRGIDVYLNFLMSGNATITMMEDVLKGVYVAKLFNDNKVVNALVNEGFKIALTKGNENISAETKLISFFYSYNDFENFQNIIDYCLDNLYVKIINCNHINELTDEIKHLPCCVLERVIHKCFKYCVINNISYEEKDELIRFLLVNLAYCYGIVYENGIFNLLQKENEMSIQKFNKLIEEMNVPNIEWNIKNISLKEDFYEISDIFIIDNIKVKLHCYYNHVEDELSIALEIIETLTNNDNIPISILTKTFVYKINSEPKTNLNCIYFSSKSKSLILKQKQFSHLIKSNPELFPQNKPLSFTVDIYYSINYSYSSILYYICLNFEMFFNNKLISSLSKNALSALLKNELCHKGKEDKVLLSIITWLHNKSKTINDDIVKCQLSFVQGDQVSLDCILNIVYYYGEYIKLYSNSLGDYIKNLFHRKMKDAYCFISNKEKEKFSWEFLNKLGAFSLKRENNENKIISTSPCINYQNNLSITNTSLVTFPTTNNNNISSTNNTSYLNSRNNAITNGNLNKNENKKKNSKNEYIDTNVNLSPFRKLLLTSCNNIQTISNISAISLKKNKSQNFDTEQSNFCNTNSNCQINKKLECSKLKIQIEKAKKKIYENKISKRYTKSEIYPKDPKIASKTKKIFSNIKNREIPTSFSSKSILYKKK